jgi:glutamate dehydrogenase/leucine dehydrogenase/N-dimethylarginine dimethylaminohydrolase
MRSNLSRQILAIGLSASLLGNATGVTYASALASPVPSLTIPINLFRAEALMPRDGFAHNAPGSLARRERGLELELFPGYHSTLLRNVQEHLLEAAAHVGIPLETLKTLITPMRQVHVRFQFRLDDGNLSKPVDDWTITMGEPAKGGMRAALDITGGTVVGLAEDMDGKPSSAVQFENLPVRGGKAGSAIDLSALSAGEKVRYMRAKVSAVMDYAWNHEHRIPYGPLFLSHAPDIGTSPKNVLDVNLMDYFADEVNRWLLQHADAVLPWLEQKDPKLARDLQILQKSAAQDGIYFDEEGSQLELPYVERILRLKRDGLLASLRLLACVTGKTAPNKDLPYGRGGIRGRTEATGEGLARAVLKWWQLLGVLKSGAKSFDGKTVAIEGFGNVGYWAAMAFARLKANIRAIAEYDQAAKEDVVFYRKKGLSADMLAAMKKYQIERKTLIGFDNTPFARQFVIKRITKDAFWELPVDLMAPCAKENTITPDVARVLRARFVAEGANGPTTTEADQILQEKGVGVLPDLVANAGGLDTSILEMRQDVEEGKEPWSLLRVSHELFAMIDHRVVEVFTHAKERGIPMRPAVHELWLLGRLPESPTTMTRLRSNLYRWRRTLRDKNPFRRLRLRPFRSLRILHYPGQVFYMVEPEHFRSIGEDNANMRMMNQSDPVIGSEQWRKLRDLITRIGGKTIIDRVEDDLPYISFAGNAGMAYEKNGIRYFIASKLRPFRRQPETALFERSFEKRGYRVNSGLFDVNEFWAGEGDMLEHGGVLYGGWGFRSDPSAHEKVAGVVGLPLVKLHLVDSYYSYLDTAVAFLDEDTAMAYLPAFDEESQQELIRRFDVPGKKLIRLSAADASLYAANTIVFGRKLVMNTVSDELVQELHDLGFEVFRTPMSEFKKSGGVGKGLVLNIPSFRIFTRPWAILRNVISVVLSPIAVFRPGAIGYSLVARPAVHSANEFESAA